MIKGVLVRHIYKTNTNKISKATIVKLLLCILCKHLKLE